MTEIAGRLNDRVRPADAAGDEFGEQGIPIDLAWTAEKVAMIVDAAEDDVKDLTAEGWRVFGPDADAIAEALTGSAKAAEEG